MILNIDINQNKKKIAFNILFFILTNNQVELYGIINQV